MGQAVLHFRKVKTGSDMANIAAHNCREKIMDDTGGLRPRPDYLKTDEPWPPAWMKDFTRISLNEGQMGKRSESIGKAWSGAVEKADLARKPQKNASKAVEAVFTASAGSFKTVTDWKKYLDDCREWADKKFGHDNVLQWNTHFDEKTPHLHMIFIPIVRTEKGNKYSSGDFLGGPEGLRQTQTKFFEDVGRKHGVTRGQEGSTKKHTDQSEWKSELIREQKKMDLTSQQKDDRIKKIEAELTKEEVREILKGEGKTFHDSWEYLDILERYKINKKETELKEKTEKLAFRENAVEVTIKNMPQSGQIAVRLAENLRGCNQQEVPRIWKKFLEKAAALFDEIKREVRAEIKAEQQKKPSQKRQEGHSWS